MNARLRLTSLLCALFGALIVMTACNGSPTGPKRIEADGDTYIACGGAMWIPSAKDTPADNSPRTYHAFFTDQHGTKHELKHVRSLWMTNLPSDAPECHSK